MNTRRFALVLGISLLLGGGAVLAGGTAAATATGPTAVYTTTKYDTTFAYFGSNEWTVTPNSAQFALHNIGTHQAWLCNTNNVGPDISPCVVGQAYTTNGDTSDIPSGFESCVYIQGDSPAWDTVPGDVAKRVCAEPPVTQTGCVVDVVHHPAVGEPRIEVTNPDYVPAVPGTDAIWANFSPDDQQATFIGPPTYPTDARGTWHDHGQLSPGQAGPDGVYANGNPDKGGNWFYRQAAVPGTPAVGTPTIEIDNPDYVPAFDEDVYGPCPTETATSEPTVEPTPTPTVTATPTPEPTPSVTETPEPSATPTDSSTPEPVPTHSNSSTPPASLAETGVNSSTPWWFVVALGLIGSGLTTMTVRQIKKDRA